MTNADEVPRTAQNRPAQRPFYLIGHNPNTISAVKAAIAAGANAIEPDINVFSHDPESLCISHLEGSRDASDLCTYLDELHEIVKENEQLSLIIFDCKPAVCQPVQGYLILTEIRNRLTYDTGINIILSVGELKDVSMFESIKDILGPREGLMIDEENDPRAVSEYFKQNQVRNPCYGDGISVPLKMIFGPNIRPGIERACALRAQTGLPKFIGVWTINDEDLKREYIKIGVDGIICDDVEELAKLVDEAALHPLIRVANRNDNPFCPTTEKYSLEIYTADSIMAGTDASLSFSLTGSSGTSEVIVNAGLRSRMESGSINYVTMPSTDLGDLISVTVSSDGSGNAPDWCLEQIIVTSTFFQGSKRAIFNLEINSHTPVTGRFNGLE